MLSGSNYCRDVDRVTLRYLITSEDKLNSATSDDEAPEEAAPRATQAQRHNLNDLYKRMRGLDIRQEAVERMSYMQG